MAPGRSGNRWLVCLSVEQHREGPKVQAGRRRHPSPLAAGRVRRFRRYRVSARPPSIQRIQTMTTMTTGVAVNWLPGWWPFRADGDAPGCWPLFRAPTASIGEAIGEVIDKAVEPMGMPIDAHDPTFGMAVREHKKDTSHDEQPPSEIAWGFHWSPTKVPHHYMAPKSTARSAQRRERNAAQLAALEAAEELELATARANAAEAARRAFERARVEPMQTKTPEPKFGFDRHRVVMTASTQADLQWQATTLSPARLPPPAPGSAAWISASAVEQAQTTESSRMPHMTLRQRAAQLEAQQSRRQNQMLDTMRAMESKRANLKAYHDKEKRLQQERKLRTMPRVVLGASGRPISGVPAAQSERYNTQARLSV